VKIKSESKANHGCFCLPKSCKIPYLRLVLREDGRYVFWVFIVGLFCFCYLCIFYHLYVDSFTYTFGWSTFLCRIKFYDTLVVIFFKRTSSSSCEYVFISIKYRSTHIYKYFHFIFRWKHTYFFTSYIVFIYIHIHIYIYVCIYTYR
jgi:hypothetical protein